MGIGMILAQGVDDLHNPHTWSEEGGFEHATRYVYYRDRKPKYIWADYDVTAGINFRNMRRTLWLIPSIVLIILISIWLFMPFRPVSMDYTDTNIVIEDSGNVLGDTTDLYQSMVYF